MAKLRQAYATKDAADSLGVLLEGALTKWLTSVSPTDLWQSCLTCGKWDDKGQLCSHYRAKPPAKVIVGQVECAVYVDGENIPF